MRPYFYLMSYRQIINCPTEGLARRPEGESQIKEIKEMAGASQPSAWKYFCYFFHFCGTQEKIHISVQLKPDYYAKPIRSPEILLKIRTG